MTAHRFTYLLSVVSLYFVFYRWETAASQWRSQKKKTFISHDGSMPLKILAKISIE